MEYAALYAVSLLVGTLSIRLTMTKAEIDKQVGTIFFAVLCPVFNTLFAVAAIAYLIMTGRKE